MPSLAELTSQQLLTRRQYIFALMRGWIYVVIWIAILFFGVYFWKSLQWYYKALVGIIAFLLVPSLEDIKDSLKPYDRYKKEWEEVIRKKGDRLI
ncbi:MAG: hypothetical protein HY035_03320 [Nitrospirae bacterium]|nr:hypothetical protein [Nitrospirota bacterium]MBI3377421.1 hypothetical protein [Nitrospirota bacterium]